MNIKYFIFVLFLILFVSYVSADVYKIDSDIAYDSGLKSYQRKTCRIDDVVFFTWRNYSSYSGNIQYGYFNTTSNTWSGTFDYIAANGAHSPVTTCIDEQNYILFHDDTNTGVDRPWVILNSSDYGVTHTRDITLIGDYTPGLPYYPAITSTNNRVYALKPLSNTTLNLDIWADGTWESNYTLAISSCVAIDIVSKGVGDNSDTVLIYCLDNSGNIHYGKSTDSGESFIVVDSPTNLAPSKCSTLLDAISVSYQNDTVVLACPGGTGNTIVFYNSTNGDNDFVMYAHNISDGGNFGSLQVTLDSNNNPWIFGEFPWTSGYFTLLYVHYNGTGWEQEVNLSVLNSPPADQNRMKSSKIPVIMKGDIIDMFYYNQTDSYYYYTNFDKKSEVEDERVGGGQEEPTLNCTPTLNENWIIDSDLVCTNYNITIGGGNLTITDGSLTLVDSNFTGTSLNITSVITGVKLNLTFSTNEYYFKLTI